MTEPLVQQLMSIIGSRLLDPLEILLDDPVSDLRASCEQAAQRWAAKLNSPQAAFAAASLIAALYPGDDVFEPPQDWWTTPLGRVVLLRVGYPGKEAVSYAVAGAMLGVTRQGVHDLVTRGKLARHPDGGVVVTSIRERIQLRGQR